MNEPKLEEADQAGLGADSEISIWDPGLESSRTESPAPPPAALVTTESEVAALTHAARMHGVLTPGSTFGVYIVGASIGEGGMARIYRAEHAGLRRQVALKVLISSGEYAPPNELSPGLSKRLTRIILRAMSLEPEARFKDMRELGRELLLLAGQRTRITWGLSFGEAQQASPPPQLGSLAPVGGSVPPPAQAPSRGRAVAWALGGLSLLIAFVLWARSAQNDPGTARLNAASNASASAAVRAPVVAALATATATAESPRSAERELTGPVVVPVASAAGRAHSRAAARNRSVVARARPAFSDESPEWALPNNGSPSARSGESRPASGSNGAPIFD